MTIVAPTNITTAPHPNIYISGQDWAGLSINPGTDQITSHFASSLIGATAETVRVTWGATNNITIEGTTGVSTCSSITPTFANWPLQYSINGTSANSINISNLNSNGFIYTTDTTSFFRPVDFRVSIKDKSFVREIIRQQLRIGRSHKNDDLINLNNNPAELRARELLLEMIGLSEFRKYLTRGFITVIGKNGTLYKISGGHHRVVSYIKGTDGKYKPNECFCLVFKDLNLPFTDGVIMRKLMVEHDEVGFRKLSNVSAYFEPCTVVVNRPFTFNDVVQRRCA